MSDVIDLNEAKAGDRVIYEDGFGHLAYRTIDRVTNSQIVIGEYSRFWKKNGREVNGSEWHSAFIYPFTGDYPKLVREHEIAQRETRHRNLMTNRLHETSWKRLSISKLERIVAILDEEDTEEEE